MKITYYGTSAGGGIPEIFCSCRVCRYARENRGKDIRTRSQAVIDGRLGIDYPVDVFMHTLHGGLDMRPIHHILITHGHHDHFLQADVLSRPLGVTEPLRFYCSEQTGQSLRHAVEVREENYRTGRTVKTCDFPVEVHYLQMFTPAEILGYQVIPLKARHAENLGSMMFVIRSGETSVLWAHDTGRFPAETVEFLKNSGIRFDFVSLDCTLKRGERITAAHMDLDLCIEMAALLRQNGNADGNTRFMLSHIGHLVERTHEELEKEAAEAGMEVAYDGLTATV